MKNMVSGLEIMEVMEMVEVEGVVGENLNGGKSEVDDLACLRFHIRQVWTYPILEDPQDICQLYRNP